MSNYYTRFNVWKNNTFFSFLYNFLFRAHKVCSAISFATAVVITCYITYILPILLSQWKSAFQIDEKGGVSYSNNKHGSLDSRMIRSIFHNRFLNIILCHWIYDNVTSAVKPYMYFLTWFILVCFCREVDADLHLFLFFCLNPSAIIHPLLL